VFVGLLFVLGVVFVVCLLWCVVYILVVVRCGLVGGVVIATIVVGSVVDVCGCCVCCVGVGLGL